MYLAFCCMVRSRSHIMCDEVVKTDCTVADRCLYSAAQETFIGTERAFEIPDGLS